MEATGKSLTALKEYAIQENLPESTLSQLKKISFKGGCPKTVEQWKYIHEIIKEHS